MAPAVTPGMFFFGEKIFGQAPILVVGTVVVLAIALVIAVVAAVTASVIAAVLYIAILANSL